MKPLNEYQNVLMFIAQSPQALADRRASQELLPEAPGEHLMSSDLSARSETSSAVTLVNRSQSDVSVAKELQALNGE